MIRSLLYVMQVGDELEGSQLKIGITSNIRSRIKSIQTANAGHVSLLCAQFVSCDSHDAKSYESSIHECLGIWRLNGEWFHASPQALLFICQNIAGTTKGDFNRFGMGDALEEAMDLLGCCDEEDDLVAELTSGLWRLWCFAHERPVPDATDAQLDILLSAGIGGSLGS